MGADVDLLEEHREHPRNMGRMGDADASGTVGSILVGRALRVFVKRAGDSLESCRFQVFSCSEEVPAASLLSEAVAGLSIAEIRDIDAQALAERVGVDRHALPVLPWGIEALREALGALEDDEHRPAVDEELGALVCRCHAVAEERLRQSIRDDELLAVDAVSAATRAGTGCGSCVRDIERILADEQDRAAEPAQRSSAGAGGGGGAQGRIALLKRIAEAAQPLLDECAAAGSEVELYDLRGAVVLIRVRGADAPAIEEQLGERLRSEIGESLSVERAD